MRILRELEPEPAVEFLKAELGHRFVQVAARCVIDYSGRAESRLPSGERLLMFKPDGTLLVHTSAKLKPVNWQPPGCAFHAAREDGQIVLTASREKPKETVRIALEEILQGKVLYKSEGPEEGSAKKGRGAKAKEKKRAA